MRDDPTLSRLVAVLYSKDVYESDSEAAPYIILIDAIIGYQAIVDKYVLCKFSGRGSCASCHSILHLGQNKCIHNAINFTLCFINSSQNSPSKAFVLNF